MSALGDNSKEFGASIGGGFKFDSHIVESLDSTSTGEDKDDTAAYTSFSSYWQRRLNAQTGLRADYNLYADFHHEFDDNDVIEQLFSIEPQWFHNQMIFSLPLQYTYGIENNDAKYHRFAIVPTTTYKIPDVNQAVDIHAVVSKINDVDEYVDFDEDGYSIGAGLGYLIFSKNRTYFRVTGDYQKMYYDARGNEYLNTVTSDKRQDEVLSIGAKHNIQITTYCDLNLNYTYIHTHSNVKTYDYDKHILQAGLLFNF